MPLSADSQFLSSKAAAGWPGLTESGAGLSEFERDRSDDMSAPIERLRAPPFRITRAVRRHPLLFVGVVVLTAATVAALAERGRASRPLDG